jgi:hypothetical protein
MLEAEGGCIFPAIHHGGHELQGGWVIVTVQEH